ncbi:MAG: OmpA family protein, partial [Bacteroidota bacterium]
KESTSTPMATEERTLSQEAITPSITINVKEPKKDKIPAAAPNKNEEPILLATEIANTDIVLKDVAAVERAPENESIDRAAEPADAKEAVQENISKPTENTSAAKPVASAPESAILQGEPSVSVFTPIVPNNKIVATDSDQDGVNDFEDPCPYIKGSIATRGCPDTDDDGLVDMVDFCPLESGPKTNGGCPVLTARKTTDQQIVSGFDHVLFNTGSITLTIDNTYDIIERAVDFLYFDKSTYVLISGHTDAEGDAASNMVLSQKRADKVKAYFVGQGISESRIKTIPYGENMPISGNGHESSRKLNRRVEITVLKRGN